MKFMLTIVIVSSLHVYLIHYACIAADRHFLKGTAHKICTEDGTWFRHPKSNLTWSNYTTCIDVEDLQVRNSIPFFYYTPKCREMLKIGYSNFSVALTVLLR